MGYLTPYAEISFQNFPTVALTTQPFMVTLQPLCQDLDQVFNFDLGVPPNYIEAMELDFGSAESVTRDVSSLVYVMNLVISNPLYSTE